MGAVLDVAVVHVGLACFTAPPGVRGPCFTPRWAAHVAHADCVGAAVAVRPPRPCLWSRRTPLVVYADVELSRSRRTWTERRRSLTSSRTVSPITPAMKSARPVSKPGSAGPGGSKPR